MRPLRDLPEESMLTLMRIERLIVERDAREGEHTFGCPHCDDIGWMLEKRTHARTQLPYTRATPCEQCVFGSIYRRQVVADQQARNGRSTPHERNQTMYISVHEED